MGDAPLERPWETAFAERYVDLSHGRTRYLEAGEGPAVILLHGVGFWASGDSWFPNIPGLASRLRVLAPDFLGWGPGDRLDAEYSFAYLVDFVREFQDALGIRRSHVLGHSMGGWIASLFAYESPDRVDRLVLVGSGGTATRPLKSMTEFQPPTLDDVRAALGRILPGGGVDLDALARRLFRYTEVPGALACYRKILRHMSDPLTRSRYNTLRRLPLVRAPTLVVWGRQDPVNELAMGELTARLVPDARLVVLDSGHFVPSERTDEFNEAVLAFL